MYKELKNKTAIITGSYGGIGNAIAESFLLNDMKVALIGRDIKKLENQKLMLLKLKNPNISIFKVDVSEQDNFKNTIEEISNQWKRIDVLVNNAGVTDDNIILRLSNEQWDRVINTNLKGTFNGCKFVSKHMIKQRYGKIINISSIVAQIGNKGQCNYIASKAGIDGITKALSKELGSRGINVNSIAPGYIETNMTKSLSKEIKNDLLNKIPLNRFGNCKEVASLATFLISDNASYITGQIINLDGGMITQ